MTKPIIVGLIAFTLLALIAMWVIGGGPRRTVSEVRDTVSAAVESGDPARFRLPWQPVEIFPTLDITEALDLTIDDTANDKYANAAYEAAYASYSQEAELAALEAEYDQLDAAASRQRTFGTPSPYAGKIGIAQDAFGVRSSNPRDEYLQIAANSGNGEPIDIAGWSLESALSGTRIQIPPAASPYIEGSANILGPVLLEPGAVAHVTTAVSPVGVSFRENICSGYLNQGRSFDPTLQEACPSPSQEIPLTAENLHMYGDACFDIINGTSQCRTPQNLPQSVSPACRTVLADALSYNGCMSRNRFRSGFHGSTWRVYLGSSRELWRDSHDVIRLLDAQGRTVSVFTY